MADLFILALTVFTFQNNTKIAINIHLLEIFALLLVFSYQFTAKCLSLPPPLLGGAISKPLILPFALAFQTSNIETVDSQNFKICMAFAFRSSNKMTANLPIEILQILLHLRGNTDNIFTSHIFSFYNIQRVVKLYSQYHVIIANSLNIILLFG